MKKYNIPVRVTPLGPEAAMLVTARVDVATGMPRVTIVRMLVGPQFIRWTGAYIHELAHVYTLDWRFPTAPAETVGMGHIYIEHLREKAGCGADSAELFADAAASSATNLAFGSYWRSCPKLPGIRSSEVRAVMSSSLGGRTPQWFAKTFKDANGNWKHEEIWAALGGIDSRISRYPATYSFRNAFGGFCSILLNNPSRQSSAVEFVDIYESQNRDAQNLGTSSFDSFFSQNIYSRVTNPWKVGGCGPQSPAITGVTPGDGSLTVSWNPPADTGGGPLTLYRVEWKLQSDTTWNDAWFGASSSAHTISGLSVGKIYNVRVSAWNVLGGSSPAETTGTPN